jgi:YaiO family outer membrane protein
MHLRYIFIIGILCIHTLVNAQDTDSLFKAAREKGFDGKRAEARALCQQALVRSPDYHEIRVFIGRLYLWDDQYDSARYYFQETIRRDSKNIDAYSAWCDAELWSDNYERALELSNQALQIDSIDADILLKKARALNNLQRYYEAFEVVNKILKLDHKNAKAFELSEIIKRNLQKNKIALTYDHDDFNKLFTPWDALSLSYTRRTKALGAVITRLNYANRFNSPGYQLEVDAYPSIGEKMYIYLNVGYSQDAIFPTTKWGASIYRTLPKSFEAEVGVRSLQFSTTTWVFTASLGKYLGNFWLNIRPNFIPGALGSSGSLNFTTRYYLSDANNYISLILGTGISADEVRIQRNDGTANSALLMSNRMRLTYQKSFKRNYIVSIGTGIAEEETSFNGFRTNYNFNFGIEKSF